MFRPLIIILGVLLSFNAMAEKVAVLSVQQALLSSKAADLFRDKLTKEFSSEQKQLVDLQAQVKKIQDKIKKGAGTQSKEVQDQQRVQFQKAYGEYQRLGQSLQQKQRQREDAFLKEMRPKLDAVIRDLIASESYDLVVNKQATIFVKPELDITSRVVELLNKK
ncbi:OmpH family outer membrane protein [Amphritea sp. 2_MG-2023]|uniref:OmpH family outer membrane protein n=1 Tax=Amphritea TaxID=515417 RepID=UPI001C07272C|nr:MULTISPECIES: OmpH family outer membrane protein [Amphritea]MBU2964894.1 OmpH family outer membrane protein [Amphritea atlantica]MDO6419943.1 OmpH family outer membrane protein [Amphritea sp. 2_MG-2023]